MSRAKDFLKEVFHSPWCRNASARMAAAYIRFVYRTGRFRKIDERYANEFWDQDKPLIFVFWHNRLLMMAMARREDKKTAMLISQHRDGAMIADTIRTFNVEVVVGSSSKGGTAAARTLLKALRAGYSIGVTPDGPRGPRMRVSSGIAQISILTGVPVMPCSYGIRWSKILKSWDRFIVALPFSEGVFVWGEPLYPPEKRTEESEEEFRRKIEDGLMAVTRRADEEVGFETMEQGPPIEAKK